MLQGKTKGKNRSTERTAMNVHEMLGRQLKATKLANYIEPLLREKPGIPISIVEDMTTEWWREVARVAGVKLPSEETRGEVVRLLWGRELSRRKHG